MSTDSSANLLEKTAADPQWTPELRGHIPALDGIRGMAIILVMIYHGMLMPHESMLADYTYRLAKAGWCGVDLFFVLSGFLITGILYDAKGGANYFRSFYVRRVVRIFPLYYLFLVLALFLIPGAFRVEQTVREGQAWFWLYLSNFWLVFQGDSNVSYPMNVTWSLSIEEQFYLIWPTVVFCFQRRALMWICGAMVLGAVVIRSALVAAGSSTEACFFLTFCRMDGLAIGALIALASRGPKGIMVLRPAARITAAAAALLLIAIGLIQRDFSSRDVPMQTIGYTALTVLFGAVLVLAVTARDRSPIARFWASRPMRMFGKYSYAMYLFHFPVQLAIVPGLISRDELVARTGSPWLAQLAFYAMTLVGTLAVALLTWNLYEKHFLKLKRLFPYR